MNFEKIAATQKLAKELLAEYDLSPDWKFCLDQSKHRIGQCRYEEREIGFSLYYIDKTPMYGIEDTIRHEIAHALVGPNHGHNRTWKAMAIKVGARPVALADEDGPKQSSAKPNYLVKCSKCGKEWKRFRLKRSLRSANARSSCCLAPLKLYRYE